MIRKPVFKPVFLALVLLSLHGHAAGQLPDSLAPPLLLPVQDFNFWIGEWNVNLRTHEADSAWKDSYTATARIYPVLGTKAILELWNEETIKGFSLRYRDVTLGEWAIWLNWPSPNRSGLSSLTGNFRHGRGEFFATSTNAQGNELLAQYTFSDISPTTLRWDDAYSSDGGNTWSQRWIMEFVRMANDPRLGGDGGPEHTFETGNRCDTPQFRNYEFLSGPWVGTSMDERERERPVALTGYQILDGCALLVFVGRTGRPETANRFAHLTWNTTRESYELLTLTADSASSAVRMFGELDGSAFSFFDTADNELASRRVRVERDENDRVLWIEELRSQSGWTVSWRGLFERFVPGVR